jgi:hypothetical protein
MSDSIIVDTAAVEQAFSTPEDAVRSAPEVPVVEGTPSETPVVEAVTEDTFTAIDASKLEGEALRAYQNMQRDYTQKTQALAEARKQYAQIEETGMDAATAAQAAQLFQRLDSDPEFAKNFIKQFQGTLQERGYWDEEAAAEDADEDYSTEIELPKELQTKIAELEAFKNSYEQEKREAFYLQQIQSQELALKDQFKYNDSQIEDIRQLAFSTQGDLNKANDLYLSMQDRFAQNYLTSKGNANAIVPPNPQGGVVQTPPVKITNMKDAENAARAAFAQEWNQ